jgi:phosphatidylcholine synthase
MSDATTPIPAAASVPRPGKRRGRRRLRLRQALAWGVHFYTALGLVAAGGIAVALLNPTPAAFKVAFLLMLLATLIDATDGALARWVRVKEAVPGFDGALLDNLIDFQTYTTLPLLLIYQAHLLPAGQEVWLLAPLLASAYGFCQVAAKTEDGYFLGFPSYWNLVAFYLYVLRPPAEISIALLVGFAVLTFVPARYLYTSKRGGRLSRLTNHLGTVWAALLLWIMWRLPDDSLPDPAADTLTHLLACISLVFPVYYLTVSWALSLERWRRRRKQRAVAGSQWAVSSEH